MSYVNVLNACSYREHDSTMDLLDEKYYADGETVTPVIYR